MSARELPEFLRVPWGIKDAFLLIVIWFVLQIILGIALVFEGRFIPEITNFLSSGDLFSTFTLYVVQVALGLGLAWAFARKYGVSWQELGWRRFKVLQAIGLVLTILVCFYFLSAAALYALQILIPGFDMNQAQTNDFTKNAGSNRNLVLIALVMLPPIFEETIFRGFIFPAFARRTGVIWAAVISSVLFGLAHFQANISVYTMILGLFLCFLYVRTRSIVPGIIVHMANNYLAFLAMTQK